MKYIWVICFLFFSDCIESQVILEQYIKIGLENNLSLSQKQNNYKISLEKLKQARGLFYPSISVNVRYTVSEGGRVIEFPVGDLMNPVNMTLNQLTASDEFPMYENQEIAFLRPTEHETKLRLVQPVFNSSISYNAKIKQQMVVAEQINVDQYKRELIAEIKKAYFAVSMAEAVMTMLQDTRLLLLENIRVNNSLVQNSKVTRDVLLRSETELYKFDRQLSNARKDRELAIAYFNFLLNRPLKDSVIMEDPGNWVSPSESSQAYMERAGLNREEIRNLEQYRKISNIAVDMNRAEKLPEIVIVADYGFQGEEYEFNKDQDYIQASAVLTWDIFSGFQNRTRIRQSVIEKDLIEQQLEEVKKQIGLQVITALEDLRTAEVGLIAAGKQVETAREGFRLVNRRYTEGQASLIEFMDARNTLTQAEENLIISKYECFSKKAEFDKVIAVDSL